ncbi:MAG: hypothetical protein Q9209_004881 [Squamulea sp. 1 TL-2023]
MISIKDRPTITNPENAFWSPVRYNNQQAENGLKEHNANRENIRCSPRKPVEVYEDDSKRPGMHKKTKSSVSLKSLIGNDKVKPPKPSTHESGDGTKLKRPKSSTGLSALLSRSKPPKEPKLECKSPIKDKENRTPPQTADLLPPPIWAQFSTQQTTGSHKSTAIPSKNRYDIEREIALYTPKAYSPSNQRNFHDIRPTLVRKAESNTRSQSKIESSAGTRAYTDMSMTSTQKQPSTGPKQTYLMVQSGSAREQPKENRRHAFEKGPEDNKEKTHADRGLAELSNAVAPSAAAKVKRGSRVMAAVAALNGTRDGAHNTQTSISVSSELDIQALESEFETLLANFIQKEKSASGSVSSTEGRTTAGPRDASRKRPITNGQSNEEQNAGQTDEDLVDKTDDEGSPKKRRSRPRSRTFTFSKGDSAKKKENPEQSKSRGRSRSRNRGSEEAERPETEPSERRGRSFSLSRAPKVATPEEFLLYMQKTQRPEDVEVGRLQKLRQLLRNEAVVWVDAFISQAGMTEVIGLLDRILKVEWREEHEDTLLHETLLCLKAMCTTSIALDQLAKNAPTLFPTLLGMLFDEQRKGPSEFATRNVVMSLLFIYLTAALPTQYETRARDILQYLRNPSKSEDTRPPDFIAQMHAPRPYHVWCNEIVNVTKEVFWIFLHHLNVIPYPQATDSTDNKPYRIAHFPQERPPIPAAPYIGGVEWDATNYLATHMDLFNGLIACLPTREERNHLRQELKDSGFEKCMGASLRTCKEKWYGYVHSCLSTWVGAALADGWDVKEVREGPKRDETVMRSPKKAKVKMEDAPKLEMPKLSLGISDGNGDDGWL